MKVPYKYPQLSKLAVPTRFSNDETNNETSTESSLMIPVINSVHHDGAMPVESPVNQSTEGTMITDTPHMQGMCCSMVKARNIMRYRHRIMHSIANFRRWTITYNNGSS